MNLEPFDNRYSSRRITGETLKANQDIPSNRADDEATIRALESAYDQAWNAQDLPSILKLLVSDAVVISPSGETSTGTTEIERSLASLFDGMAKGSEHSSEISAVRFVTKDVAIADGEATIKGLRAADGSALPPMRHRFTDVLVRRGQDWRIAQVRAYVFMRRPDA